MDQYNLDTEWNLWYHSIVNNDWSKQSYQKLMTIRNLFDYKLVIDSYKKNHYQNGMFFIMKDNIYPMWEDPSNRNGGCLSFKVPSSNVVEEWNLLFLKLLNQTIMEDSNETINGISISPKKEFNIVKVWFANNSNEYTKKFIEFDGSFTIKNSLYKKHSF